MQPPEFMVVAFHHPEIPMFLGHETPGDTVNRLAREKFGLKPEDFNPKAKGHMAGSDGKGYVFEVELKSLAAHNLQKQAHPDVMAIMEPMPKRDFGLGARDPKDLPPHVKKKFGGPQF